MTTEHTLACLDENTIAALLGGLLTNEEVAAVDAHVDGCPACRMLLSNVAPLLDSPAPPVVPAQHTISRTIELDPIRWNASMRVGRLLKDKWHLDRLLGVGGTAAVYEATHKNHGGRVAIKVIHAGLELDPQERRRFLGEGYAANAVGHPGIVQVIDDDVDEAGSLFLVSELCEGETLHARLGRLGPLAVDEVLAFADDVLDVLAAAHERGIIHRDIKPENILAGVNGQTKLLDFGMALVREEVTTPSNLGVALGTPAFMPPEQALGAAHDLGPTADIWALGATMFTLLSGRLVHDARTVTDSMQRAAKLPAPTLASVFDGVPEEVQHVVDRALAFSPADRWPSARAMQEAVREAAAVVAREESDAGEEETIENPPRRPDVAVRPAPRIAFAWVAGLVALLGLAAWLGTRGSAPARPNETLSAKPIPIVTTPPEIDPAPSEATAEPEATEVASLPSATPPRPPKIIGHAKPRPSQAPSSTPPAGSSWLDRRTR